MDKLTPEQQIRVDESWKYIKPFFQKKINAGMYYIPDCLEKQDILSFAYLALVKASLSYDASKGTKFNSYIFYKVHYNLLDKLRQITHSRSHGKSIKFFTEVTGDLGDKTNIFEMLECFDGRFKNVDTELDANTLFQLCSNREKYVLAMHISGVTLKEIGKRMGLSESGISLIRTKALRKLRPHLN